MRRFVTGIAALLLALMVLPAFAADDKDKKDPAPDAKKDVEKDKEPPAEKPIKIGVIGGKITEVNESAKSIKLEITTEVSKPNYGEMQALRNCQIQLAQTRDPGTILSLRQQMIQHELNLNKREKKTSTVEYAGTDDLKVRLAEPPPAFDEKTGNVKKRTAKELRELKGDPKDPDFKLPGYPGTFTDLHQGARVMVTLVRKRGAAHHTGVKPKDADPDMEKDNMPEASMIEILPDPPGAK